MNRSSLAVLLGALALSASAQAQECKTDTDCDKGFACEVTGASGGCATIEPAPAPNCKPGETCPDAGAVPPDQGTCDSQPMEYRSCVPAKCTQDSDCGADMVCFTQTSGGCAGSAGSSSGSSGAAPDPGFAPPQDSTGCTTTTEQRCLPKYLAPCKASADCGEGFDCVPQQNCACSAGTGTATPGSGSGSDAKALPMSGSGGAAEAPAADGGSAVPADCTCTDTGVNYCQMKEIACDTDAQCPTNWTCQKLNAGDGVACARPALPPSDGGVPADAGAFVGCDPAEPPVTSDKGVCEPPYFRDFGIAEDGSLGAGQATSGSGTPPKSAGGETANEASGPGDTKSSSDSSSGMCSVSRVGSEGTDATLAFGALSVLGLVLRMRRRQARASR
ncbi:MAG TPA: hypothetical protein VHM19_05380 [Polyangiales bacterium]|nr:hypothetical protein [Polyangiales bacterium]